jgi:hypothetical protein
MTFARAGYAAAHVCEKRAVSADMDSLPAIEDVDLIIKGCVIKKNHNILPKTGRKIGRKLRVVYRKSAKYARERGSNRSRIRSETTEKQVETRGQSAKNLTKSPEMGENNEKNA